MTRRLDFVTLIVLGAALLMLGTALLLQANQGLNQDSGIYAAPAFHVREASHSTQESQPRLTCLVNRPHRLVHDADDFVLGPSSASAVTGERVVCVSVQQTAEQSGVGSVAFERIAVLDKPTAL